jgi:hypothetical protein
MSFGPTKQRSRAICLLMIAGALFGAAFTAFSPVAKIVGGGITLVSLVVGILLAVRLRCDNCGYVLSEKLPAGALPLLWLAKEDCPNCKQPLC